MALSHAAGPEVSLIDAGTFDGGGDDGRFDAGEALDSPGGVGDLMDECLFDAVSWVVGVLVENDVTVELGGVLAGDDGVFGEQAVFECIFGDAGLAFFGARSGRFGCVFSVGPNLGLCWHDLPPSWAACPLIRVRWGSKSIGGLRWAKSFGMSGYLFCSYVTGCSRRQVREPFFGGCGQTLRGKKVRATGANKQGKRFHMAQRRFWGVRLEPEDEAKRLRSSQPSAGGQGENRFGRSCAERLFLRPVRGFS